MAAQRDRLIVLETNYAHLQEKIDTMTETSLSRGTRALVDDWKYRS